MELAKSSYFWARSLQLQCSTPPSGVTTALIIRGREEVTAPGREIPVRHLENEEFLAVCYGILDSPQQSQ